MSPRHRPSPGGERPGGLFRRSLASHSIRGRLVRILVVSVALVIALLSVTIAGEVSDYTAAGRTRDAVSLALTVQDTTQELQRERGLTVGFLGGEARFAAAIGPQRAGTDRARAALVDAVSDDGVPGADRVRTAMNRLNDLVTTREAIDAGRADRAKTFEYYTAAIAALNEVELGFDEAQDAGLRRGLLALGALADAKEATGQERAYLNGVFAAGRFNPGEYIRFTEIRATKLVNLAAFARETTTARQAQLDATLRSGAATKAAASESIAISAGDGPLRTNVDPVGWWSEMTSVIDGMRDVQRSVGNDLQARAGELRDDASRTLAVILVLALLAMALEVALVAGAVRSIVWPLVSLAVEADDVAANRLPASVAGWHEAGGAEPAPPEPVRTPERAGTEIVSVAAALNRVQTTAFELAGEQALLRRNTTESLANLGRRNQNLLRRQLGFISELEREELDPTALANLFELDHLATRMRRNAESLLVLVSESEARRWAEPLPITEVIRAALSEVEDYRRATLRGVEEVLITGSMVSELSHLLAELIENALAFSPPHLEVEIHGRKLGSRYLLAVEDHGVGMSREQLAKANRRLHGEEDFVVAPTRFLGHYVVGQLARRLGVEVELTVAAVSGTVARLLLPEDVLAKGVPPQPTPIADEAPTPPEEEHVLWQSARGTLPPVPVPEPRRVPDEPAAPRQPERTRNGLVKRMPKKPAEPQPAPARPATSWTETRSPEDVRSMLATFRSGHQRGTAVAEESP